MSRIRLEWNIESQKVDQANGEDPQAQRARRRTFLRFLLLLALLLALIGTAGILLRQRLHDVEKQMEQLLRDTVSAEVAALRIGDANTFLNLQYDGDQAWRQAQRATFQRYSEMKTSENLILTGAVLDLEIDGRRARATVEEYINGVPYAQVWFYLRRDDGWYHAPPDYGFWGEARSIDADGVVVEYHAADQRFAEAISASIGGWWRQGCDLLACDSQPELRVSIVTDSANLLTWTDDARLRLQALSPFVGRAQAHTPFTRELQQQAADAIAERLVDLQSGNLIVAYPHDVVYLRGALIRYLTDQFLGVYSGTTLLHALAEEYGADALSKLVRQFGSDSNMSILRQVIPVSIDEARLDWSDFIIWRLNTEAELLAGRDESGWLNMYDTANESVQALLYDRFHANRPYQALEVVDQLIWHPSAGHPQLRVTLRVQSVNGVEEQIVLFNLVDGVWKRAS